MVLDLFVWCIVVTGILSFCGSSSHVLSMLLSLEFLVLAVFLQLIMSFDDFSLYVGVWFLVFSVCEGALGLTLVVMMSRVFGGDYLGSFTLS